MYCPLQYRFGKQFSLPERQLCANTFGTVQHACVEYMEINRDLEGALQRFEEWWADPEVLGRLQHAADPDAPNSQQSLVITDWLPGRSWEWYAEKGRAQLLRWWQIARWETDEILGWEIRFEAPFRGHTLTGTVDQVRLRYDPAAMQRYVVVRDLKTSRDETQFKYEYLRHNSQGTFYSAASETPEFWEQAGQPETFARLQGITRRFEIAGLETGRIFPGGLRTEADYNRLEYAITQMERAITLGVFMPNLNGGVCKFCAYRKPCGLGDLSIEELEV